MIMDMQQLAAYADLHAYMWADSSRMYCHSDWGPPSGESQDLTGKDGMGGRSGALGISGMGGMLLV